jgi:putative tributyrin esterase
VIVMPDVHKSFYCDMAHGSQDWSFIAEELPMLINRWFKVSAAPKDTFVAGLSMGGYGAMKLALNCPNRFAAAASIAGALDIAAHVNDEWDESRAATFKAIFDSVEKIPGSPNDLISELGKIRSVLSTKFYACCGTEDYLYQDSVSFRDQAIKVGLDLTYEDGPGEHDWKFCDAWIQRVLDWLPVEKFDCG